MPAKDAPEPEAGWRQARLIPTTGIGATREQEMRATSALLAVMTAVPEFGRALLVHADAPAGRISTYIEVAFPGDEPTLRPDGAVVVERGKLRWTALVEVKTAGNQLDSKQVESYLDLARSNGVDAVITIATQLTTSPAESPVAIDRRKTKSVSLHHLSWSHVLTEAVLQREHRKISDPDQSWILGELIEYVRHPASGAGGFDDMGDKWVEVRERARAGTLRATDVGLRDVASRWEQFLQSLAFQLQQELGRDVAPVWPRRLDVPTRVQISIDALATSGQLSGAIRVPDAIAPIDLTADLKARQFTTSIELQPPREGRAKTRITWLLRQLRDAPGNLRVDVFYPNARESTAERLTSAQEKPEKLLFRADPHREPNLFRVSLVGDLGSKRGSGAGSFVLMSRAQVLGFYREIVQRLKPWTPNAPKLPEAKTTNVEMQSPLEAADEVHTEPA